MTRNEIQNIVLDALIDAGFARNRDVPLDTKLIGTDSLCLLEVELLIERKLSIRLELGRLARYLTAGQKGPIPHLSLAFLQREAPTFDFTALPPQPNTRELLDLMTIQALIDLTVHTYAIQTAQKEIAHATR